MQRQLVYLALGIIATILFVLFKVELYESIYYSQGFSDKFYNLGLYDAVAIITAVIAWGGAVIYYYVINSVKFDRWYHWLITLAVVTVIAPVVCYAYNDYVFADNNLLYIGESVYFEFVNMLFTALLFVIASFSVRWWSSNCRHTPIPQ